MRPCFRILSAAVCFAFICSCASFNPGTPNISSAASTPGAVEKEGVSVLVREFGPSESKRIFDADVYGKGYQPLAISISNRSEYQVEFVPNSIPQYVNAEEVVEKTKFNTGTRLALISLPWFINLALSQPLYYGIAWPIFGLIDMGSANTANRDRAEYFNNLAIKPIKLQPGQDIQGVVFVRKGYPKPLQLKLSKNGIPLVYEIFPIF